jgi:hypothetical protein
MLNFDKELIGCVCPQRRLDLSSALSAARTMDPETAIATSTDFTAYFEKPRVLSVREGLCEVDGIGMGLTLIRKDCVLGLSDKVNQSTRHAFGADPLLGFFDPEPSSPYAEDWAFCKRWNTSGGKVWALVNEPIGHIGEFTYRASYVARLKTPPLSSPENARDAPR